MTRGQTRIVVVAGAVLVALGSILPWLVTATGQVVWTGTEGDGVLTLGLAVLLALVALFAPPLLALALAILTASLVAYEAWALAGVAARHDGSLGVGLWLALAGAVVALVASVVIVRTREEAPSR